jgi:DNA polymerase-1
MVNVERALDRLTKRFDTDDVLMCISAGRNFRYDVDPTYKQNRKGTRKPLAYSAVLEKIEADYPSFKHDGLEADDVMGIFATRDSNTIICSMDKDMKTIPCTLFDGKAVKKIDKTTADYWFFYQVLVGDTADGYPGLPGCGPKKAEKLLEQSDAEKAGLVSRWDKIVAAYVKKGLTEADAIKQARLARILRNSDWDAKKKQPILWTP